MIAIKGNDLKENFKSFCEKVFEGETLIISRPKNENVIMISEKSFNDLKKQAENAKYLEMLEKSYEEEKNGKVVVKTIKELESYE